MASVSKLELFPMLREGFDSTHVQKQKTVDRWFINEVLWHHVEEVEGVGSAPLRCKESGSRIATQSGGESSSLGQQHRTA